MDNSIFELLPTYQCYAVTAEQITARRQTVRIDVHQVERVAEHIRHKQQPGPVEQPNPVNG